MILGRGLLLHKKSFRTKWPDISAMLTASNKPMNPGRNELWNGKTSMPRKTSSNGIRKSP
jgi:hypothetical protein